MRTRQELETKLTETYDNIEEKNFSFFLRESIRRASRLLNKNKPEVKTKDVQGLDVTLLELCSNMSDEKLEEFIKLSIKETNELLNKKRKNGA